MRSRRFPLTEGLGFRRPRGFIPFFFFLFSFESKFKGESPKSDNEEEEEEEGKKKSKKKKKKKESAEEKEKRLKEEEIKLRKEIEKQLKNIAKAAERVRNDQDSFHIKVADCSYRSRNETRLCHKHLIGQELAFDAGKVGDWQDLSLSRTPQSHQYSAFGKTA